MKSENSSGWYKKAITINPSSPSKNFSLGQIVITRGAEQYCAENSVDFTSLLRRHLTGDWGELSEEDKQTNKESIERKGMVLSSYKVGPGKLWIITDPGWETTTILLPEEY